MNEISRSILKVVIPVKNALNVNMGLLTRHVNHISVPSKESGVARRDCKRTRRESRMLVNMLFSLSKHVTR